MQTGKVEVDQSIRIEELTKDTIVGIANKEVSFTVVIPRRAKRVLREKFRREGKRKKFAPYVFAATISEALKRAPFQTSDVIIDIEYPGYEKEILAIIKQRHRDVEIYFTAVGKKSPAHFVAYGVYSRKKKADFAISTSIAPELLHPGTSPTIRSPHERSRYIVTSHIKLSSPPTALAARQVLE